MAVPDGDLRRMLGAAQALAERTALSATPEKVCVEAVAALSQAGDDLPFGLTYLFEHVTGTARLTGSWGEVPEAVGTPATVPLSLLEGGAWLAGSAPECVLVVPFIPPGSVRADGALVAGLGPRNGPDHRSIIELLAAQLGSAIAAARTRSAERLRATAPNSLRELADASHALATSLNADEISGVVIDLVLPDHGLWCAVWLVRTDERGNRRVDVRHDVTFPEHAAQLRRAFDDTGADVRGPLGVDECLSTARVVVRPLTSRWPRRVPALGGNLAVTVPMRARGRVVGAITFGRTETDHTDLPDQFYIEELGRRAALAFDNAAMYAAEQRVALGLQRSLLPRLPAEVPGLRFAARYLPGARGTKVGGDWYDMLPLPDGRIGLSIGDVVGNGVRAAARMGQLRTALRSYAVRGQTPAQVLKELDMFLSMAGGSRFATCLYAVFQPATAELRIANAGHLPPLLLVPGEEPRFVEAGTGVPLGGASRLVTDGPAFSTKKVRLPDNASLVLYTDGLVELKNRVLDNGLGLLRQALRGTFGSAEEICDRALSAMDIDDEAQDDTTLLVLQRN